MFEGDLRPEHNEGQFCRLCFNKSDDLCPLFPPASIPNKALLHKIFDCTTITLSFRDDHNAQICSSCIVSVEAFFKYKIKCVENDKLLRKRRTNFFSGLGLTSDSATAHESGILDEEKQPDKKLLKSETDNKPENAGNCQVKQELIEDEEDDEYFNPDQFLAQETQIGDKQLDQSSLNGTEHSNFSDSNASFERGWKTTEFSLQPGSSGLKPLKITDYSNLTGKRGRPQKFITTVPTERLLAPRASQYPNPFRTSSPMSTPMRGYDTAYRQHINLSNGGRLPAPPTVPLASPYDSVSMSTVEQTRKVQKFLDDGLRDLILNAGAPNPNFALDNGYTNFKVVKARCNSYNLIFEANRFLRRNKSCSGLPKWYWACSMNGCPVKICSYKGRLFKTNDKINHIHPPTETDDKQHEVVLPHQADEMVLQQPPPVVHTHMQQLRQQFQQRPQIQPQNVKLPPDPLLTAMEESSNNSAIDYNGLENSSAYEMSKDDDGNEILLHQKHKHKHVSTEKDGTKLWKCTTINSEGNVCSDTIHQTVDGRIKLEKNVKKEEESEDECDETTNDDEAESVDGGKRKSRPPKVAVYEGYHYKYCHARPEGSLYWRCVMKQDNNCLVSMHTKASYEFLNFNDQQHNHDPPDPSVQLENSVLCSITAPAAVPSTPPSGSTDFQLVKSGQKREFLIYQGYRYYFQYESKNGKRSYRCTMFRNCPAGAFLMPDNTIAEAKNFVHTHPPTENLEKYVTKDSLITSPIKDAAGQPARQQQTVAESGQFPMLNEPAVSASSNEEVARANGYKIIKNYKNKEILIYNGWRYFVDYKKKNGGQVWRCSSHRLCRGAVHLFPDGSINYAKVVDHNHMPPRRSLTTSMETGMRASDSFNNSYTSGVLPETASNAYAPPYHRYIMHHGHRFRFATRKREGTIYWRCAMRLETKCPVSFHTKEDSYELVSMRNHEHNHEIPTTWPEVAGGQIDEELPTVKMPQEEIGTSDFILTKNSKGRNVILYQNGRYYLDYSRKDGKIVFRCSSVAGCRATVLLLPNKTLQVSRDLVHTHGNMPLMDQSVTSMMDQSISSSMLDQSVSLLDRSTETKLDDDVHLIAPADPLNIDLEPSDPTTSSSFQLPNFIVHHGYHYKFISKQIEDQTAYWRCSNYEAKMNCLASIYTTLTGAVLRTSNIMHNHRAEDYNNAAANNSLAKRKTLIGSRDYKIVKNWKMRDVLVFQQCRYFLHYVRKDGRKVWRCSAIRSCHAAVYLGADGRVDQVKGEHVHDIRAEGEPRRRRARKPRLELMANEANGNGSSNQENGNEWIDYSDYGMQMNSSSNDNNSLWDNFNPHQMTAGVVGESDENFDFNYHSVFGNQSGFTDSFGMLSNVNDTAGLDDDDEGLPLEPDVSFQENENNTFEHLQNEHDLEPVVQIGSVE